MRHPVAPRRSAAGTPTPAAPGQPVERPDGASSPVYAAMGAGLRMV